MAPDVQLLRAKDSHAAELAQSMRAGDVVEVLASGFESPEECLRWGIATSCIAVTFTLGDRVAAMLGVRDAGAGVGRVWLITADFVYRYPRLFISWARPMLAMLSNRFKQLVFDIDTSVRHQRAVRLLEWLGAEPGRSRLVAGVTFREYCFTGGV